MTSNHHAPYDLGYTRTTMAHTTSCKMATSSESLKMRLSSDWSLQLDSMKSESLVIADQHAAVNTFSGFVHTARQTTKVDNTRSRWANLLGGSRRR
jgi:septal ring-binding cell division protein DamX